MRELVDVILRFRPSALSLKSSSEVCEKTIRETPFLAALHGELAGLRVRANLKWQGLQFCHSFSDSAPLWRWLGVEPFRARNLKQGETAVTAEEVATEAKNSSGQLRSESHRFSLAPDGELFGRKLVFPENGLTDGLSKQAGACSSALSDDLDGSELSGDEKTVTDPNPKSPFVEPEDDTGDMAICRARVSKLAKATEPSKIIERRFAGGWGSVVPLMGLIKQEVESFRFVEPSRFVLGAVLGSGTFGTVHLCQLGGRIFAAKLANAETTDDELFTELGLMIAVKAGVSPADSHLIVQVVSAIIQPGLRGIIMPIMTPSVMYVRMLYKHLYAASESDGSRKKWKSESEWHSFQTTWLLPLWVQLAEALRALHGVGGGVGGAGGEVGVIHGDLKLCQFMMNLSLDAARAAHPVLCDLGTANLVSAGKPTAKAKAQKAAPPKTSTPLIGLTGLRKFAGVKSVGTVGWASGRAMAEAGITKRDDVCSLGRMLYELCFGAPLFLSEGLDTVSACLKYMRTSLRGTMFALHEKYGIPATRDEVAKLKALQAQAYIDHEMADVMPEETLAVSDKKKVKLRIIYYCAHRHIHAVSRHGATLIGSTKCSRTPPQTPQSVICSLVFEK